MVEGEFFNNKDDLYDKVYPALYSKKKELNNLGYKNINERDIWNCLTKYEWKDITKLELCDVISDILYLDSKLIENYFNEYKLKNDTCIINTK